MARRGLVSGSAAVTVVGLVTIAVSLGLVVPETEYLIGYPAAARLDVRRPATGFVPLAARYTARILGLADPATPASGERTTSRPPSPSEGRSLPPTASVPARQVVDHAFTNDAFDEAFVIEAVPFVARTNTGSATRENEPAACAPVGGTAWYRYTPDRDEILLAGTSGSDHSVVLGVFTGDRAESLATVGCARGPTGRAQLAFRAKRGTTYSFQVTGVAGGGNLVFGLRSVGRTARVSVSSTGQQANAESYAPSISADGRYVAFNSGATNLTPDQCSEEGGNEPVCRTQVFVHDRVTGTTALVSRASDGKVADAASSNPSVSADGRFIAFVSSATNLSPGPQSCSSGPRVARSCTVQVYVHDRVTGTTERLSEAANGGPAHGDNLRPSISGDGRSVAFESNAEDLLAGAGPLPTCPDAQPVAVVVTGAIEVGAPGPCWQVHVRDRLTGRTTLVSQRPGGGYAAGTSAGASISSDGRTVAFVSADTLVEGDGNAVADVFARDLGAARTELISVSTARGQGNRASAGSVAGGHYVSGDGRFVAFRSDADNLVPDDTNGGADFFVRDRALATTVRVSVTSAGAEMHPTKTPLTTAGTLAISDDGRFVGFDANAPDLVENDTRGALDVFVRDLELGITTLASVSSLGEQGDYHSFGPAFDARGTVVAFSSSASNLVEGDSNTGCVAPANTAGNCSDIFVHELEGAA